jgi:hypothetical protein
MAFLAKEIIMETPLSIYLETMIGLQDCGFETRVKIIEV